MHESSSDASETPPSPPAASRLALSLFAIYTLFYLGFVLLNAFAADSMDVLVFAGLNLAIVYGFGLILAAIVMAFVYGFALREDEWGRGPAERKVAERKVAEQLATERKASHDEPSQDEASS